MVAGLRLVSEYRRVCERRKLRVNVGKSKAMRCSWYGNGDRIHVILKGEQLEEVDCFKNLGSKVAADEGCERDVVYRMNEEYNAWGALKCLLSYISRIRDNGQEVFIRRSNCTKGVVRSRSIGYVMC